MLTMPSFDAGLVMLYRWEVTFFLALLPILGSLCIYIFCSVTVQYGKMAFLAFTLYPQCK